jgi:hypothetical protein
VAVRDAWATIPVTDAALRFLEFQDREHAAWLDVGREFKALGLDMNSGGNAERLHDAIVRWGEELAQLRLNDPDSMHAERALGERRAAYRSATDG